MLKTLTCHRIIPVVEIEHADDAVPLAEALATGGIGILEITLRTVAALDAIERIRIDLPELMVGVGTVQTLNQVSMALSAGAQFGVAPGLNPEIVAGFKSRNIPFVPGVLTPTEIEKALGLDCTLLKLFPAEPIGGIKFLRALAGPFKNRTLQICATGGISPANMKQYLDTPLVWAIGGSWIATRQQIADNRWTQIAAQAKQAKERLPDIDSHDQT